MLTLTSCRMSLSPLTHENAATDLSAESGSKLYKIGELAVMTNATTRTLRYYEELGLLQPIRNTSGQRLYNEAALARLNFINELKSGGFSLNEIKIFFESWQNNKTGAEAAGATAAVIQQKLEEISSLQKRISKLNDELREMASFLLSCQKCEDKPSVSNCSVCDKHNGARTPPFLLNLLQKN